MDHSKPRIYRHKFTPNFAEILHIFAKSHRYDDRFTFKEAFEKWIKEHEEIVTSETKYLEDNGFTNSVLDKMYLAARHYYRKKKNAKNEPKKRKRYVNIDKELKKKMDDHIVDSCRRKDFKPATAFSDFCETHQTSLECEVQRLVEIYVQENLPEDDIPSKLKKTYKNRYDLWRQNAITCVHETCDHAS